MYMRIINATGNGATSILGKHKTLGRKQKADEEGKKKIEGPLYTCLLMALTLLRPNGLHVYLTYDSILHGVHTGKYMNIKIKEDDLRKKLFRIKGNIYQLGGYCWSCIGRGEKEDRG